MVAGTSYYRETERNGAEAPAQKSFQGFLRSVMEARTGCDAVSGVRDSQVQRAAQERIEKVYRTGWYSSPGPSVAKTVMNEASGTAGGYLVPLEYGLKLMKTIAEESFIWPLAQVIPMAAAEGYYPRIDVETVQSAGTSPFFGGVTFKWGNEQAPSETEPTFRQNSLKAWDLLGYATLSNDLLMDTGPAGEMYLVKLMGKAAAWAAEYAFLQGTGTAAQMPLGIVNAPATLTVTRATPNQIGAADIAGMAAKLLPHSWANAIWATSPSCMAQIVAISSYFLNSAPVVDDFRSNVGTLVSRPLFITEKLPALGTQGDCILFDPWLYVIGVRQEILVDVSPHTLFQTNQTVFRTWFRCDGKPQCSNKITLQDGTTTVSPYVVLK